MAADQRAPEAPRDSHDLSLSPRTITRDSLVSNMLLSLDQYSLGQSSSTFPTSTGGPSANLASRSAGPPVSLTESRTWPATASLGGRVIKNDEQKNRYQDLYGSDADADESSPYVSRYPRSRRSNSSSTFQALYPRASSGAGSHSIGFGNSFDARDSTGTARILHSRGGRTSSKGSSGSASIDAGYPPNIASQHWALGGFRRSLSFDHGTWQTQAQLQQEQQQQQQQHHHHHHQQSHQLNAPLSSPFRIDFPSSFATDDYYSAAPNPTVPGGPRRIASAVQIPLSRPEPVDFPSLERRRSISRSVKSSTLQTRRETNVHPAVPTMSFTDIDSAPAPNVSYGKVKEDASPGYPNGTPGQQKERQGFFRRVFGSSKNGPPTTTPEPHTPSRYYPPSTRQTQQSPSYSRAPAMTPPVRDTISSHSNHPVIQKKPSSFFRRRKKSVADEPPPLPGDVPPIPYFNEHSGQFNGSDPSYQKSPASSLRKVMNPYLHEGSDVPGMRGHTNAALADITNMSWEPSKDHDDSREYKRDFSPDYEPSPTAKIRAVTSDSDLEPTWSTDSQNSSDLRSTNKAVRRSNSFLDLDGGSDNEEELSQSMAKSHSANSRDTGRASSPGSKSPDAHTTIRPKKQGLNRKDLAIETELAHLKLSIPGNRSTSHASGSTDAGYQTAPSAPPSVRIDAAAETSPNFSRIFKALDEPEFSIGQPSENDRQKAQSIYDGSEEFVSKEKAAAWMGEEGTVRQRTLRAYIELYDFTELSIVNALRRVCSRLILRAETQQVDRILVAFSARWCECNPNHGFKATDVIHTICYSIMLLNTDLHVADIDQKMTRSQFVKNTLGTIMQAVADAAPDAFERPSILDKQAFMASDNVRPSTDYDRRTFRNSFRPLPRTDTQSSELVDECGPLVKVPFYGNMKGWEEQIETVLKGIYASIRDDRLPLFGAEPDRHLNNAASHGSLSVMGMLKRTPSVLSKAPSEGQMSCRGRITDSNRANSARWASKSRSRPGLGRAGFNSSRTSFDDANSLWSPALSSATWSRYSLGRTQGSMSQDSFGSAMPRGDFHQSIGFANALSQAIIRDEDSTVPDGMSVLSVDATPSTMMLEDESLELAGPPWVKEGRVMHKHHLDGVGKRAKDRNWSEVFAVVQKGQMSLFSFNASKSARQKSRSRNVPRPGVPVGGGNWQDNAVNLGTFNLRLTLASALPSPGYSRSRPYVWALSLPTGAVHLFQVGTPEIIKEFVDTANYWSSRLSTHPLTGGISNIEYGWSDAVVNTAMVNSTNDSSGASIMSGRTSRPGSSSAHHRRQSSIQSGSLHSASIDFGSGAFTQGGRGKLPGDRIHISNWTPPTQSMRPSNLLEADQLQVLASYVKGIEDDLQTHNQLRAPMNLAYSPRGQNANKAMANWEKKSAYLLRESVKFRTYVDALTQAESRKREIYKERDLARRAARGELNDDEMEVSGAEEGDLTLRP